VRIVIRDHGVGIEAEHLSRIFDPYFSTQQTGRGLGLATVHSIVRQHNGHIQVRSTPGQGTTFTVLLPAQREQDQPQQQATPPQQSVSRAARILLMDDEDMVLEVTTMILRKLGHDVDQAHDGEAAIACVRQALDDGRPYDCLIMDLTIPNAMGGQEAITHILALDPHARALVSSGYATDAVMANYADYGFVGVLPKPFTLKSLRKALDEVLQQARTTP